MKLELRVYDEERDGDKKHFIGRIPLINGEMMYPLDEESTTFFPCGKVLIGVEYRYLGAENGISIHVCDRDRTEFLRFDCFEARAHYHYVCRDEGYADRFFIDTAAEGDPVLWTLNRLRTRLPEMLERTGATGLGDGFRPDEMDAAVAEVALASYRAIGMVRDSDAGSKVAP